MYPRRRCIRNKNGLFYVIYKSMQKVPHILRISDLDDDCMICKQPAWLEPGTLKS